MRDLGTAVTVGIVCAAACAAAFAAASWIVPYERDRFAELCEARWELPTRALTARGRYTCLVRHPDLGWMPEQNVRP